MLRHYDAIGLLRPDRVDLVNGYRYYNAAQLARCCDCGRPSWERPCRRLRTGWFRSRQGSVRSKVRGECLPTMS
ncbi:hypothetical protein AB0L82_43050 [Nocardia sp. NPDC052001]|uniref:hypothetical protein n=1 Tax=Nocardia sp. NPDC052001 TaxID=3154853 RepID=UPI0034182370